MAVYLGLHSISLFCLLFFVSTKFFASCSILFPKSQRYQTVHLMDTMICRARHPLQLSPGLNSAIIIETDKRFNRWYNRTNDLRCKFVIKAPKGDHLFAVIQNLSFRKGEHGCIDYIEFRRKGEIDSDVRMCGEFNRRKSKKLSDGTQQKIESSSHLVEEDNENNYQYSVRYDEFDIDGEIETTVFVSKKSLLPNESLNLTIAYTPYKDCDKVDSDEYESTTYGICLWKEYFCDGIQNCVIDRCSDEEYCSRNIFGNGPGTKMTIGAVVTIILCFLKFLASLWICKRYKIFCWSADCVGPPPNNNRSIHADREPENLANQSTSVPPVLLVSVLPSSHDKDLPPSYESLFPEHVNPAATQST